MATHTHTVLEGETGFVIGAKGYLLSIEGLPSARVGDIIVNERGDRALVTSLDEHELQALLLDPGDAEAGDTFVAEAHGIQLSCGEHLFGRVINALGDPLDKKGSFPVPSYALTLDGYAPGLYERTALTEPLKTGMAAIDVLLPLAKGQRELVVGPISSGKNIFAESVVAHQKNTDVVSIYAFVGRPRSYVESVAARILGEKGNPNTIVLASLSDEPAPLVYLTPPIAVSIAEWFQRNGRDVVLILDDLGTHAKYIREISLLSGRIPGRESYPGDIFYQHARLLERGGKFTKTVGGGSITILPLLETGIEDISSLVSTNLMAATDGHLFFSPERHAEGRFPAVVPSQSVTRVGRGAQSNLLKQLSIAVQSTLAEYEKQNSFVQFGTDLSEHARSVMARGRLLELFLRQEPYQSRTLTAQIILLALAFTPLFANRDLSFAQTNRERIVEAVAKSKSIAELVKTTERGTITLQQYLKRLESALPYFESICRER